MYIYIYMLIPYTELEYNICIINYMRFEYNNI